MTSNVISMAEYRRRKLGIITHPRDSVSQINVDMEEEAAWIQQLDVIDAELDSIHDRLMNLVEE